MTTAPATPFSNRPKYTPKPGDTSDDIISHLRKEIEWLELVIKTARDDLKDGDDSSAYIVLIHSGVSS